MKRDNGGAWIGAKDFAVLIGCSAQMARRVFANAVLGKRWRGCELLIREVHGVGGVAGRAYEVAVSSIPLHLLPEAHATETSVVETQVPRVDGRRSIGDFDWRLAILSPAIAAHHRGEPTWPILEQLAAYPHATPEGPRRFGATTLRTWLEGYSKAGWEGLKRRGRSDKGKARVIISKRWDDATAALPIAKREEIRAEIVAAIRSRWANGGSSRRVVAQLVAKELIKLTLAAGIDLPESVAERFKICAVPEQLVRSERRVRKIHLARTDAKGFKDKYLPHIQRLGPGWPMECVSADVTPSDIPWLRADGTEAMPRIIGWVDWNTRRLKVDVVFPEKGDGVRREHIAASFIGMCLHTDWGVPASLQPDNGSEYKGTWIEVAADIMRLRGFGGPRIIMRAAPYAAASKIIEAIWSVVQRCFFSMLPNYIGGNRLKSKSANEGKKPEPFTGTKAEYVANIQAAVAAYNAMPLASGPLAGMSPNEAFERKKAAGWLRTDVEPASVHACFATEVERRVKTDFFTIEGERYNARFLIDYAGEKIIARIPLIGSRDAVAVMTPSGDFIGHARLEARYRYDDPQGVQEKRRRVKAVRDRIAEEAATISKLNLAEDLADYASMRASGTPTGSASMIEPGDTLRAITHDKAKLPKKGEPAPLYQGTPSQFVAVGALAKALRRKLA